VHATAAALTTLHRSGRPVDRTTAKEFTFSPLAPAMAAILGDGALSVAQLVET